MTQKQRRLARLAATIQGKLTTSIRQRAKIDLPEHRWEQVRQDLRQLSYAARRGWQAALNSQRTCATLLLRNLVNDLIVLQGRVEELFTIARPPSPRDIYLDLVALEEEFDKVEWQGRNQRLSVTTEPIELEGVHLGAFRIELTLNAIGEARPYSIVALNANPAAKDDSITHPHVSDGQLCEGEGGGPIKAALRGGRLLDFFQIVNSILHTYNADGPYVSLDAWDGASCVDCDYTIEGDCYTCSACHSTLCSECERCCSGCNDSLCSECYSSCDLCGDTLCSGCTHYCDGCNRGCCSGCLQTDERCNNCHAKEVHIELAPATV